MPTFIGCVVLETDCSVKRLPRALKFLGFAHPFSGAVGVRYMVCGSTMEETISGEIKGDDVLWKFVVAEHGVVINHDLSDWLVAGTEFVGGKLVTVFAKQEHPSGGAS